MSVQVAVYSLLFGWNFSNGYHIRGKVLKIWFAIQLEFTKIKMFTERSLGIMLEIGFIPILHWNLWTCPHFYGTVNGNRLKFGRQQIYVLGIMTLKLAEYLSLYQALCYLETSVSLYVKISIRASRVFHSYAILFSLPKEGNAIEKDRLTDISKYVIDCNKNVCASGCKLVIL